MVDTASAQAIDNLRRAFPPQVQSQVVGPQSGNGVDVPEYLAKYGVSIKKEKRHGSSTLYILDRCLFDESHAGGEAAIGQTGGGKLFYQCFHDSCKGRTWHDARQIISGNDRIAPVIQNFFRPPVNNAKPQEQDDWPEPIKLPDGLKPVTVFDYELLPSTLRPWAKDIAERMQCPPDYVAVTIMAALGAVVGRRIGIRPQSKTDWTVAPNLWAKLIGRPGLLKSPAMEAALGPLKSLSAASAKRYQAEHDEYETAKVVEKLRKEAAEKNVWDAFKKDPNADVSHLLKIERVEPPVQKRYMTNDPTAAALGELHRLNPNGLMIFRDELVSLLKMLDREENAEARGFYLTGWNGDSPYTFDRITRGMNLYIPAVCLSVVGSTQPARITQYAKAAVNGTSGDDGLIQRFGMVVWPDASPDWKDVDRWPDSESKRQAHHIFEQLDKLDPYDIGAETDTDFNGNPSGMPYLRFDTEGLALFREWRTNLEKRLRSGYLHPAMESHLAKYRKLVPGLALIIHLSSGGNGPVNRDATLRALAWSEYLQTHAERLYSSVINLDVSVALKIVAKIRAGKLPKVFRIRDLYRPKWAGLTNLSEIKTGIKLLVDHDWLLEVIPDTGG